MVAELNACVALQWETFFMALSAGDVLGVWFAASNPVLKGAAVVLADVVLFDLIRGKGFSVR